MASKYEYDYMKLVSSVLDKGHVRTTRAGKAISTFNKQLVVTSLRYNEFPILEGRKMFYAGVIGELAAMLKGPNHVSDFTRQGCNYWADWADPNGDLRLDYGNAWLDFNGVNQLESLIQQLKDDPYGRRHIITGWRPDRLPELSLPCCHILYQWYVTGDGYLDMLWYQRSTDVMIGLPSDVILAAVWNALIAKEVGLKPGTINFSWGDTHVYAEHLAKAQEYIERVKALDTLGRPPEYTLGKATLFNFDPLHVSLIGYTPQAPITFTRNV